MFAVLQGTQQPVEQEVQELIQHLPVVDIQVHLEEVTQLQDLATHRQDKASLPTLFQATQHSLEAILPNLCILLHLVVILLELQEVILLLEDNQVILLTLVDLEAILLLHRLIHLYRELIPLRLEVILPRLALHILPSDTECFSFHCD